MVTVAVAVVAGVILLEAVCFFGRIVLKKTGARIRPIIGVHHGSIGALLIFVYCVSLLPRDLLLWGCLTLGLILLLSDLVHHCLLKIFYGAWDPAEVDPKGRS